MDEWVQLAVAVSAAATDAISYIGILSVVVESEDTACFTYTLLNNGSETTLCSECFARELGIAGKSITFDVTSINDRRVRHEGREINVEVRPLDGGDAIELPKC